MPHQGADGVRHAIEALERAHRHRQAERKPQIAHQQLETILGEPLGQVEPVDGRGDEHALVGQQPAKLLADQRAHASLHHRLEAGAVDHRRVFDACNHALHRRERVGAIQRVEHQHRSADAEAVHLAIQFLIERLARATSPLAPMRWT